MTGAILPNDDTENRMATMSSEIASRRSESLEDHAERWRDWLDEREELQVELGGDELDPVDLASFGLAALQRATDHALAETDRKTRKADVSLAGEIADLRRSLDDLGAECRRRVEEADALRVRVAKLEADLEESDKQVAAASKVIAELKFELARDRAWRRMLEERKFAPIVETVALEQARRKTQLAIEGRSQ